jgi:hypothetical protein
VHLLHQDIADGRQPSDETGIEDRPLPDRDSPTLRSAHLKSDQQQARQRQVRCLSPPPLSMNAGRRLHRGYLLSWTVTPVSVFHLTRAGSRRRLRHTRQFWVVLQSTAALPEDQPRHVRRTAAQVGAFRTGRSVVEALAGTRRFLREALSFGVVYRQVGEEVEVVAAAPSHTTAAVGSLRANT